MRSLAERLLRSTGPCLIGLCFAAVTLIAQQARETAAFEIASIKPSSFKASESHVMVAGVAFPGGQWRVTNASMAQILRNLYGVRRPEQIVGAPSWFDTDLFVINAKAADLSASPAQMTAMAKRLLADRFKLRLQIVQRPFDVHVMVLSRPDGKLGPGLRPSACGTTAPPPQSIPVGPGGQPIRCGAQKRDMVDGVWRYHVVGQVVANLIMMRGIDNLLDTLVFDRTGLEGAFDIDLAYVPESARTKTGVDAPIGQTLLIAMDNSASNSNAAAS